MKTTNRNRASNPIRDFIKVSGVNVLTAGAFEKIENNFLIVTFPVQLELHGFKNQVPRYLQVPKDYVFDGASIPKILQPMLGKKDSPEFLLAACVHDFLYWNFDMDRRMADETFYHLLRASGVSNWKAAIFYLGVRSFGAFFKS